MGTVYVLGAGFSKTCGIATDMEMLDSLNRLLTPTVEKVGGPPRTTIEYLREQNFHNQREVSFELFMSTLSSLKFLAEYLGPGRNVFREEEKEIRSALPTQHVLYFGIQAKTGKLDAAGISRDGNANIAEILNQVTMMLGHEIFDPEIGKRVLVDHAFIVAGGEITKAARNWLGNKLDASKRSQVMFMDRDDILNLFVVTNLPLPRGALPEAGPLPDDDLPF